MLQGPRKTSRVLRLTLQGRRITTVGLLKNSLLLGKPIFAISSSTLPIAGHPLSGTVSVTTAGGQHELGVRIHQPDGNSYVDLIFSQRLPRLLMPYGPWTVIAS